MADLRARIELAKLARELGVDEAQLGYLADAPANGLRELRRVTCAALSRRHEARATLLASANQILPVAVAAKISEQALGAGPSARVASAMEPEAAARLAAHLAPAFLADLAARLDPTRVGAIVARLPDATVLDVAQRLLAADDVVTLARFVAVVDPAIAAQVAGRATGAELLRIVLYAEDAAALGVLARRLPEAALVGMLEAADDEEYAVAVELLDGLDAAARHRVLDQVERPGRF